jgi:opacity protein-like surface antigen
MKGEANMKNALIKNLYLVLAVTAVTAIFSSLAWAQGSCARCGEMEISIPIIYTDSATIEGEGNSEVDINSDWSPAFSIGYNYDSHFNVSGLFSWSSRGYEAKIVGNDLLNNHYNGTLDAFTMMLNGTYYFLDKNITPFVSGGLGLTYTDTNIPSGMGETYCYWDPWWGYVCSSYVPTKTDNSWNYNLGLGLRWDATSSFSLQAGYNKSWVDFGGASGGMPDFDIFKLDIIFRSKP